MNFTEIEADLIYGLIGIFLFVFRNPDKRLLYLTSLFVFGLFVSQMVFNYIGMLPGQVVWILSASGLLLCYFQRLRGKHEQGILDLLKVVGLLLLVIYPLPFYSLVYVSGDDLWTVLRQLTFFIIGTIYLYDRWILKPEQMKRKYLIVLVGQSFIILVMMVYAFIQQGVAKQSEVRAIEQAKVAP